MHAKRITILPKDMALTRRIRGETALKPASAIPLFTLNPDG
jgi:hypothetical protein